MLLDDLQWTDPARVLTLLESLLVDEGLHRFTLHWNHIRSDDENEHQKHPTTRMEANRREIVSKNQRRAQTLLYKSLLWVTLTVNRDRDT